MVIECCWCNTVTGEKDGGGITSTICTPCVDKHFPEHATEFRRQRVAYNVVASQPVQRSGGIDYYPQVVNPAPVGKEQADSIITEQMSRGIRCRLEGVVAWAS